MHMTIDNHDNPLIGPGDVQDEPSMLIEEARERLRKEDERNTEGKKLARRLFIAFAMIAVLGVVFYIVLPHYGVRMPAILPVLCFIAIMVGTVMAAREDATNTDDDPDQCCREDDDGRPIGCCQGPRPLRAFKDDTRPKR
jgi:F0F1-type ATP synthase assembly protein I